MTPVCEPQVHVSGFIATLTTLLAGGTVALHDGFDLDTYVYRNAGRPECGTAGVD